MAKNVLILYCGGWGYGGTALRLSDAIESKFAGVNVDCQPDYDGPGGRIDVIIIGSNQDRKKVWTGSRAQAYNDIDKILKIVGENIKWFKNWTVQ